MPCAPPPETRFQKKKTGAVKDDLVCFFLKKKFIAGKWGGSTPPPEPNIISRKAREKCKIFHVIYSSGASVEPFFLIVLPYPPLRFSCLVGGVHNQWPFQHCFQSLCLPVSVRNRSKIAPWSLPMILFVWCTVWWSLVIFRMSWLEPAPELNSWSSWLWSRNSSPFPPRVWHSCAGWN
jgi:hypothetical protein